MREIIRKKHVKTTTFVTLLVAATMIISGFVTGIAMNMNEKTTMSANTGEIATLGASENAINSEPEFTDVNVGSAGKHYPAPPTLGPCTWDNGMHYVDGMTAQARPYGYYDGEPADDFHFDCVTPIQAVEFLIIYIYDWEDGDYLIRFYEDDGTGTMPGALYAEYHLDTVDYYVEDFMGYPVYHHTAFIPPGLVFESCQKYWISIQSKVWYYPRTFWAMHDDQILLDEGSFRSQYFTGGVWRKMSEQVGTPFDFCFRLVFEAEHDLGLDIIHPRTCDTPGCPCIPVELLLRNCGNNDEFDVPVFVEIHQNLWTSSFPGDTPDEMVWMSTGIWNIVPWESSYPFAVGPFHGQSMAEFDQTGHTYAYGDLITMYPTELCGDCINPFLKFYMWHDDYGSDDQLRVYISTVSDAGPWIMIGGPYERLCCPDCPIGWKEYRIDLSEFICNSVWFKFEGYADGTPSAYDLHIDYVSVFNLMYAASDEVDIPSGECKTVEFPCWEAECWWCQYADEDVEFQVGAWFELETDEWPFNDGFGPFQTDFKEIFIHVPPEHDVGDKAILEPSEPYYMAQELPMKQLIKNYGKNPESCFNVYMTVEKIVGATGGTCFDEDFSSWPPSGWTVIDWEQSSTSVAGGVAPEARLYWLDYTDYNLLMSPACDTQGSSALTLEFKSLIDPYSTYSGYYYVYITADGGVWSDITPWSNPVSGSNLPWSGALNVDAFIGPATQVAFWMYIDDYWKYDNWYIDDVTLWAPLEYQYELVYSEKVCIDWIDVCEEQEVVFPPWTPEPPEDCYCGTVGYRICSFTKMLDPPDEDPSNDMICKMITIEFLHDVGIVEFVEPAAPLGVDFLGYHDGTTESAWRWTDYSDWSHAIQLTDAKLAPYRTYDITQVEFSCGDDVYGFCVADYEIWISDTLEDPTAPPVVYGTGQSSGTGWDIVPLDMAYDIPSSGDVYLGITYSNYPTGTFPAGVDHSFYSPEAFWWYYPGAGGWVDAAPYLGQTCWGLSAGVTPGGDDDELPDPEVYIPCGESDIIVKVENFGTYDEDPVVIDWWLYEYQPAKTQVDGGQVIIALAAGAQQNVLLGTFDFTPGVYELEVVINLVPPSMDCNLANNGPETLIIGVDCCEPDSCFVLDPEEPNGENNWYVTDVTVTVDAWDTCDVQSGISHIVYVVDGVENTIMGDHGVFVISGDGVHHVLIYAVDNVGHEGVHHTFEVAIDATDPTVDLVYNKFTDDAGTNFVEFTALASDDTSGMNRVEFSIDGVLKETIPGAGPYVYTVAWAGYDENTKVRATAFDDAGNDDYDEESGIKFEKARSQSQSRSKTLTVSREILNLLR